MTPEFVLGFVLGFVFLGLLVYLMHRFIFGAQND